MKSGCTRKGASRTRFNSREPRQAPSQPRIPGLSKSVRSGEVDDPVINFHHANDLSGCRLVPLTRRIIFTIIIIVVVRPLEEC